MVGSSMAFIVSHSLEIVPEVARNLTPVNTPDWAQHGICGRAVFLDLVRYFTRNGDPLPYDPWSTHGFTVDELKACAEYEGVQFKQADILIIRGGFIRKYYESSQEEKDRIGSSPEQL